jgi:zinc protease
MRALSFAAEKVSETVGLPRLSAAPASFLPLLWLRQPQRVPLAFFAAALLAGCGASPTPIDRTKLPTPGAEPKWAPPPVETWTLPNGMNVWFVRQDQAPLISVRVVFPRGGAADPPGKAGLTSLVGDMLDEGAGGRTSLQISDDLQRLAIDFGASTATDATLVSMDILADKLPESLKIFASLLRTPDFPAEEFERRKAQRIAQALSDEATPGTAASLTLRRALFGDGYGSQAPNGTRASLQALTVDDVKAQYKAVIQPKGATVVVVGPTDRPTVERALLAVFDNWRGEPTAAVQAIEASGPPAQIRFVDFPGSTQSVVQVARRVPGVGADEIFASEVYNWALGGAFTSRLNLNLREEKGYTYGARSGFNRWRQGGFFGLGASVKADTTRPSIDEMLKEIREIAANRPVTEVERNEAVNGMLLGFPGDFERMAQVAGELAGLAVDDRPADFLRQWPEKLAAVTTAEANAQAKARAEGAWTIVVVGDKASLLPTLQSLGLPVVEHDAQGNPLPAAPAEAAPADKAPADKAPADKAPADKAP